MSDSHFVSQRTGDTSQNDKFTEKSYFRAKTAPYALLVIVLLQ